MKMLIDNIKIIQSIPRIISTHDYTTSISEEFIREKLIRAENDKDIIMVSRGEGKKIRVDYIKTEEFFTWGVKSQHATIENIKIQELLNPSNYSKELLLELVQQLEYSLNYGRDGYHLNIGKELNQEKLIIKLKNAIINPRNERDLKIIKDYLCGYLHVFYNPHYTNVKCRSLFISSQMGENRISRARHFGVGIPSYHSITKPNKSYVVFDYWVSKEEQNEGYYIAKDFYTKLNEYDLIWFNKFRQYYNDEVLIKYVMFPHRIVGYYYYEDNELKYYFVNPHYVETWVYNKEANIGDNIFIIQDETDITTGYPYNLIYGTCDFKQFNVLRRNSI
ncbi:hypothetical protein [Clostridium tagluense]|uniref:hypothetical protein n=1 Tax=Clostridium tagluense TaxID=360422 RepID=UPI001C6DE312|nr:hypothetical protein [Clostridium tagluense]MBW9158796.1 hypothetical protein [Clostridium tagluense]WLC67412.1 hypothetical protein KTC93_09655 [Clostridium tagluense]